MENMSRAWVTSMSPQGTLMTWPGRKVCLEQSFMARDSIDQDPPETVWSRAPEEPKRKSRTGTAIRPTRASRSSLKNNVRVSFSGGDGISGALRLDATSHRLLGQPGEQVRRGRRSRRSARACDDAGVSAA